MGVYTVNFPRRSVWKSKKLRLLFAVLHAACGLSYIVALGLEYTVFSAFYPLLVVFAFDVLPEAVEHHCERVFFGLLLYGLLRCFS